MRLKTFLLIFTNALGQESYVRTVARSELGAVLTGMSARFSWWPGFTQVRVGSVSPYNVIHDGTRLLTHDVTVFQGGITQFER